MPQGVETVYYFPPGEVDKHGDPVGEAAEPVQIDGCITWPRTSTEEGRGEVIVAGLNVFLPPSAPVIPSAKGEVVARGERYQVDGEPAVYLKGGTTKGTLVVLNRRST